MIWRGGAITGGLLIYPIRRLLENYFHKDNIKIEAHENSLTSTCFIQGIPCEKLIYPELYPADQDFPETITTLAKKA